MWPKLDQVSCNFSPSYLPIIKQAVDIGAIEWLSTSGFGESCRTVFLFAGCKWEMEEISEIVVSVVLHCGTIEPEALTAAILKGKIGNS